MADYPRLIKQKTSTTCGQCVIAMLFDITVADATSMIGHDRETKDHEIKRVSATNLDFESGEPEKGAIAIQKHKDPKGKREHWTLFWKDKTFDPANKGEDLWPVSKHLRMSWQWSLEEDYVGIVDVIQEGWRRD